MAKQTRCPDPTGDPDRCSTCNGWGHLCSEWRRTHPNQVRSVTDAYYSGFDPNRFYTSTAAAQAGELATARQRKAGQ